MEPEPTADDKLDAGKDPLNDAKKNLLNRTLNSKCYYCARGAEDSLLSQLINKCGCGNISGCPLQCQQDLLHQCEGKCCKRYKHIGRHECRAGVEATIASAATVHVPPSLDRPSSSYEWMSELADAAARAAIIATAGAGG